ncbi:Asp-tRNA(Asn)/Glu-tRNA(Gln) amidotransferase subunit GatB [Coraliomargarita akajimensis]|uniref:Aspartyl/glutamyl-tRNA(Asn/Gln) amidotransferase subunit B n=1 Tax=Coraliomargarita akajimensis (strain DSM 45221 / IAM 15411 / JCM 23193 / KCTC 12865 / 04OKA010-24) TaxID=583355 RepID=D5EJ27_CORAD|nr:Asp-tRNA(Asn)/Glu-tRNA(Gln) amidotransferase subunit GatB [Coraliomargarita akajimensis]ADE54426.1 glutamyl-tRNA(Gln) amidotransferase, B subunit [Coraliomargarita akajimensis DSM 45221]
MEFEAVIGLEIHVQVKTRTKMFTAAPYNYGAEPNTLTDPVVLGLPGTLPVLNHEAIEKCAKLGLMLGCEIAEECKWDRKNYFYPDSPKNYQLTQNEQPLCIGGEIEIELADAARNAAGEHRWVKLNRIHLEEDPGKLTHEAFDTLIDFNRAGVPLAEIVTEPDMTSSAEAVAFLNALRNLIIYAGISDCDMEKGQLRCDANVSLKPVGSDTLGTRTEMKNLNSISNVKAAIEYEIERQTEILEEGGKVVQETRRWDVDKACSFSLRSKEEAHDYRYFPDPDLMPVQMDRARVAELKASLPERPFDKQRRFEADFKLPYTVTSVLCPNRELSEFFEAALETHNAPKLIANYVANDLLRELSEASEHGQQALSVSESKLTPAHIGTLAKIIEDGTISKQIAKEVFTDMFQSGDMPDAIVEKKGLKQSNDTGEIEALCREAIAGNAKAVGQYKDGNAKALNALKGPVMKATKGKANPAMLDELLKKLIDEG